jgi:hypothetical protein
MGQFRKLFFPFNCVFIFSKTWKFFIRSIDLVQPDLRICGLYYKQVTIVIYDRNDSGQYYKNTIMIVIDDRQL